MLLFCYVDDLNFHSIVHLIEAVFDPRLVPFSERPRWHSLSPKPKVPCEAGGLCLFATGVGGSQEQDLHRDFPKY